MAGVVNEQREKRVDSGAGLVENWTIISNFVRIRCDIPSVRLRGEFHYGLLAVFRINRVGNHSSGAIKNLDRLRAVSSDPEPDLTVKLPSENRNERNDEMPVKTYEYSVESKGYCHVSNVTGDAADALGRSGLRDGIACIAVVGSTAGVSTLEYEPGLLKDVPEFLERITPAEQPYHHDQTWHDGNGFSHIRSFLLKTSLCVPFRDGQLMLGTWQQIVVADFDNRPRTRKFVVQLVGE
jgi:secondary thiamine-phosphate synthase enzyme